MGCAAGRSGIGPDISCADRAVRARLGPAPPRACRWHAPR